MVEGLPRAAPGTPVAGPRSPPREHPPAPGPAHGTGPRDPATLDSIALMSAAAKPPLIIDPLGHGLEWVRKLQFTSSYRDVEAPDMSRHARQLFYASVAAASRSGVCQTRCGCSSRR